MARHAILRGGEIVPVADVLECARWYESSDRRIAKIEIGEATVSTVFLGLDHGFSGWSVWFETMVFGGVLDGETERYATLEEAMAGHERMVELVRGQE